jgi:CubicO group peptidase (beta-lactamase class C family)
MGSAIPQEQLLEIVRSAQARTGVSSASVALHVDGTTTFAGSHERPFRIASITKSFTATAVHLAGLLDDRRRTLLSHTAGYRPERPEPLPPECDGLWSYSNAGYWEAAAGFDGEYSDGLRELMLEPLGLRHTGFETPADAVLGTLPGDVVADPSYPVERRPSGGLWSTVGDLVEYGLAHCGQEWAKLHEPVGEALGARYALGWWVRDGVLDHEGSVGGYQSLLLLVPERRLVLAALTNSWRGSALIRHVVEDLGLVPPATPRPDEEEFEGTYAIEGFEAVVADGSVTEIEADPLTGTRLETRYPLRLDAPLMSWRSDFPRPDVGRIGWVALPRAGA